MVKLLLALFEEFEGAVVGRQEWLTWGEWRTENNDTQCELLFREAWYGGEKREKAVT